MAVLNFGRRNILPKCSIPVLTAAASIRMTFLTILVDRKTVDNKLRRSIVYTSSLPFPQLPAVVVPYVPGMLLFTCRTDSMDISFQPIIRKFFKLCTVSRFPVGVSFLKRSYIFFQADSDPQKWLTIEAVVSCRPYCTL